MSKRQIVLIAVVVFAASLAAMLAYDGLKTALSDPCDRVPKHVLNTAVGSKRMEDYLSMWKATGQTERRRKWCENQVRLWEERSRR